MQGPLSAQLSHSSHSTPGQEWCTLLSTYANVKAATVMLALP